MSCINCTSVPHIPIGEQLVYINAAHDYILERVGEQLEAAGVQATVKPLQISLTTENFRALIEHLGSDPSLTTLERENINILPLIRGEAFDFGKTLSARNLENWFTLLHADSLIRILETGSLKIFFQPIIDIATMDVYGYECLSRGVLPDGALMPPQQMFETARKTGLLFNLDRQCRETCLRAAAKHQLKGHIFINFLPSAIYNPEFCLRDTVRWAQELNFDAKRIIFEVVETERVEDTEHLKKILAFYKQSGFRTALDDMGSGYASLNLFASLHPDILKIDMDLVRDIERVEVKQAVARALTQIGHHAGTKVLAEGVETEAEFAWLKQLGVDYVQGYYFGKPSEQPLRCI